MNRDVLDRVENLMCTCVRRTQVLSGGDLSQIYRLTLDDGRDVVAKGGPAPRTEAGMLRAIQAAGAPAPSVLAVDDSVLVLGFAEGSASPGDAWKAIGDGLRTLHAATGDAYGWPEDFAFGPVTIANGPTTDWPTFWAERRLRPFESYVAPQLARRIDRLCDDLPNRLPASPKPALLHGDLWGGNVMTSGDRLTAFIDPACYYGHVEVDIAMLCLFDRPTPAFFAAYGALEPGHGDRRPVYTLWPALVHLRLFGGAYETMVDRILKTTGF